MLFNVKCAAPSAMPHSFTERERGFGGGGGGQDHHSLDKRLHCLTMSGGDERRGGCQKNSRGKRRRGQREEEMKREGEKWREGGSHQ